MKSLLMLFILLLLQSCTTQPVMQQVVTPSDIPNEWRASGRIGAIIDGKSQNSSFDIKFNNQNFELILTGALGLGQISIISKSTSLKINNKKSILNLKQFMLQKFGWYFPLNKLGNIVFEHHLNTADEWKLDITKFEQYQGASMAKVVKLKHLNKPIKIKLIFKQILPNLAKVSS
jgi:outer membrane biogenesis lipoprotein LolB